MADLSGRALPATYRDLLTQIKAEVGAAQLKAARTVNAELIGVYWRVGRLILARQREEGWGAQVITRLAADLRLEFPDQRGFSPRSLNYMRQFAAAFTDEAIVQQAAAQLPWTHLHVLLDQIHDHDTRLWYARRDAENGWSRAVLEHHIATRLRDRIGSAPSNFADQLAPADSDLAGEIVKDPYVFDFLGFTEPAEERVLEQALMGQLQQTLAEFGPGYAFVGRQVPFNVDGDEFIVDLLLFNASQVRYVVVELKVGKFRPEYAGQIGFYVAVVDDLLRDPKVHAPTVGILVCTDRNEKVVRYALRASTAPMAVATYTYDTLPPTEQAALPAVDAITAALTPAGQPTHTAD